MAQDGQNCMDAPILRLNDRWAASVGMNPSRVFSPLDAGALPGISVPRWQPVSPSP